MTIYNLSGKNWRNSPIWAPVFNTGDIFYTIYNNQILAIKIIKSYIKLIDTNMAKICARFETPLKNTIFDGKGELVLNSNKETEITMGNYTYRPVYITSYDASNNSKCTCLDDITKYEIINTGYSYGKMGMYGWNYYIGLYYWDYNTTSLIPARETVSANTFLLKDHKLTLAKDGVSIGNKKWSTEEEVKQYLSNKNKNLDIVSFDKSKINQEPKVFNINIEVNTNMSLEEITNIVSKKLDSFKN